MEINEPLDDEDRIAANGGSTVKSFLVIDVRVKVKPLLLKELRLPSLFSKETVLRTSYNRHQLCSLTYIVYFIATEVSLFIAFHCDINSQIYCDNSQEENWLKMGTLKAPKIVHKNFDLSNHQFNVLTLYILFLLFLFSGSTHRFFIPLFNVEVLGILVFTSTTSF